MDTMAAYQNVYMGREVLARSPFLRVFNKVDDRAMRQGARDVLDDLGVKIPSVNANVKQMSGGQRQCLAIARAVLWGRRIVILDEPTAALGVHESEQVLDLVSRLRERKISVILVTHNMQHLMQVADRVTVMRLGRTIAISQRKEHNWRGDRGPHHRRPSSGRGDGGPGGVAIIPRRQPRNRPRQSADYRRPWATELD